MVCRFTDKVYAFAQENALFSTPCHLIVGVSGGPDSMALLHCLMCWPEDGLKITVVHIHHGLRDKTADRDAAFVQAYCAEHGIPCVVEYADVSAAATGHVSLEAAGRQLRYQLFEQIRMREGADFILTAHNADDQAETVLMRILRGSGVDGLAGVSVKRDRICRPLLICTRDEIEQYCADNAISYVQDETNTDLTFTRNRIRHEILPMLRTVNPALNTALLRLSRHALEDATLLRVQAEEALQQAQRGTHWHLPSFLQQPQPIRRRMITLMLSNASVSNIEEAHIVAIERTMTSGDGSTYVSNGKIVSVEQERVTVIAREHADIEDLVVSVEGIPFQSRFGDAVVSLQTVMQSQEENIHNLFLNTAVDYDRIQGKLFIRSRREGDYIHPAGRDCGKSLKKLMNEWQIPRHVRGTYPLLCDALGVVLVPGFGCDERVKPTADTKHFLVWQTDAVQG